MGFIEYHGVRGSENVAEAILLERKIGEQQMMINDYDVGFLRDAARGNHMATRKFLAALPKAVVASRGDLRPQRVRVRKSTHLRKIARSRGQCPTFDTRAHAVRLIGLVERELGGASTDSIAAHVICTTLEQGHARRSSDGGGEQRQILGEKLILKSTSAGGDEHARA